MADTALELVDTTPSQIVRPSNFAPRSLQEAIQFAEMVVQAGMLPKSYVGKPPAMVVVAMQFGAELGLQPMQSLQNIANINGQPGIWGDAALALVLTSPLCEYVIEDEPDTIKANKKATCRAKRRGNPKEIVRSFTYEDAATAGIINNTVWKTYPWRMCQMRARSFCLRDAFPDILKGLALAEEIQDYNGGPTIDAGASTNPVTTTVTTQTQTAETDPPIGQEKASAWYRAYKASGWLPAEAAAWLKEHLHIEPPKDSRDIPTSKYETAMQWASTKAPIRVQVEEMFGVLGWTIEEQQKLVGEKKLNWTAIKDHLSAEIDKRNAEQQ